jgi:endoglucanase
MKIRLLIIFIFSLISLLAVAGKMLISNKEFTAKSSVAHADSPDVTIYSDSLGSGFLNWSWNSTVSLDNTEHPNSGTSAISFTPNSNGGLYFHTDTAITAQNYDTLQLSVRASVDNQKFAVVLYDDANQQIQSPTPLENFGGDVTKDSYKQYTIPLLSLNPSMKPIKGIAIQENSGQTQPMLYIDDVLLKAKQNAVTPTAPITPSDTPMPTGIQPTLTPTALSQSSQTSTTPATSLSVFSDSLSNGFENWSWGSSVNLDTAAPYYSGTKSITLTVSNAWGALFLHRNTPLNTSPYTSLSFSVRGSEAGQKYSLVLRDENNVNIGNPLPLGTIGGDPLATLWRSYNVSLSTLSAENKTVSGIVIQDASGHAQPALYVDNMMFRGSGTATSFPAPSPSTVPSTPQVSIVNNVNDPFSSNRLFLDANSNAKKTADATALWAANNDSITEVSNYVKNAGASGSMGVVVAYNIPGRDCGLYSTGGADYTGYKTWITKLADTIGTNKVAVILEPDALGLDCLQNDNTYSLLRYAVDTLTAKPNIAVYAEASSWVSTDTMSQRLKKIGIEKTNGFSLNTSGYNTTTSMISYGSLLSSKVGGKHFVIDTSRNGNGPYDPTQSQPWCNPPGRAIGYYPTTSTGQTNVDAYLWIKIPGESDGTCRGGPSAGAWWAEYALDLVK